MGMDIALSMTIISFLVLRKSTGTLFGMVEYQNVLFGSFIVSRAQIFKIASFSHILTLSMRWQHDVMIFITYSKTKLC